MGAAYTGDLAGGRFRHARCNCLGHVPIPKKTFKPSIARRREICDRFTEGDPKEAAMKNVTSSFDVMAQIPTNLEQHKQDRGAAVKRLRRLLKTLGRNVLGGLTAIFVLAFCSLPGF